MTPTDAPSDNFVPPTELQAKYSYDQAYQFKILALIVRHVNFIHQYGEVVLPEYFEFELLAIMCRLIVSYHKTYSLSPTPEALSAVVVDYCTKYKVSSTVSQSLMQISQAVFSVDLSDSLSIKDSVVNFAKRQQMKIGVAKIVHLLNNDSGYQQAAMIMQKALMVGEGLGSIGTETYASIPNLPQLLSTGAYSTAGKLLTPFPLLNSTRYGGLGPGEIMVIVGSSGQGKSIFKNNFGYWFSGQVNDGRWVAHATLELSEVDNHVRYAAIILDVTQEDIIKNTDIYRDRMSKMSHAANIQVKWFQPLVTSPSTLRSWISSVSSALGHGPCALIVDYPDKMCPSTGLIDNLYMDNMRIYGELIGLLHDYQMPGVVSSQVDKYNQYKDNTRGSNMNNSIAKLYDADVVAVINQTEEMKNQGVGRLWIDKSRRGRDKFYIDYGIDYSRAKIWQIETAVTSEVMPIGTIPTPTFAY